MTRFDWGYAKLAAIMCFIVVLATSVVFTSGVAFAADPNAESIWPAPGDDVVVDREQIPPLPREFELRALAILELLSALEEAPIEGRGMGVSLPLPLPNGAFATVEVVESPLIAEGFTIREVLSDGTTMDHPMVGLAKTYAFRQSSNSAGSNSDDSDAMISGRLLVDESKSEVQAIMLTPEGMVRIMPIQTNMGTHYGSFFDRDRTDGANENFLINHPPDEQPEERIPPPAIAALDMAAYAGQAGDQLRTYRLAVATSGEYYQTRGNDITAVVNSIIAEVNAANTLFETELSVRLLLNWAVLYMDPDNDAYSDNSNACALRDDNEAAINNALNLTDFDIGFVFGTGGGNGCAWYVLCLNDKARGAGRIDTANVMPGGSSGLLWHEMGHQLGAFHTFSGQAGNCTAGEYNEGHGIAPGSGSTIMSYLGGCDSDDVDTTGYGNSSYYHSQSFEEINTNLTIGNGAACVTLQATTNNAPMVDAGMDYTIPRDTPFTLTGSATDPEGDPLTYVWEQIDVAVGQRPIDSAGLADSPIFRSVPPSLLTSRTFPRLPDILNNNFQRKGEILPTVDRMMNFRLTARDDRVGGGGVGSDTIKITVAEDPFQVTSPNGGETFGAGCEIPVTWLVGGGSVATDVELLRSEDGGNSFTSVVASTPNDGAGMAMLSCTATNQGRIKAQAVGNIFFDISDTDYETIQVDPDVVINEAIGGEVDNACEFTVTFAATVTDDCGVMTDGVTVGVTKTKGVATLGTPVVMTVQDDPTTVTVTGEFLVSDVGMDGNMDPATFRIDVTGEDKCGLETTASDVVTVVDTTPPTIAVSLAPDTLWPPNHKLVDIAATVNVMDNCPTTSFVLTSVASNEPDNGKADGNTVDDIQNADLGIPDTNFSLRAERAGTGAGRTYTAVYTAQDGSKNKTDASDTVFVPHNR